MVRLRAQSAHRHNAFHSGRRPRARAMELREAAVPRTHSHEVLIKVRAAAVCGTDLHVYQSDELQRPRRARASDNFSRGLIDSHVVEVGGGFRTIMDEPFPTD